MSPIFMTVALYLWLIVVGGLVYVLLRKCYGNELSERAA